MATVLLVIDSPTIQALMAELVMFAGYQSVLPRGDESPVDAMLRRGVDAVVVDIELARSVVDACERAAREHSVALIYVASDNHTGELRALAESRRTSYFALPNGPKLLARVIGEALARSGRQTVDTGTLPPYQLIAASRAIAESRGLVDGARLARQENRGLRDRVLVDDATSRMDVLRVATMEYLRHLRGDGVPRERAMELVTAVMRESAQATGVPDLFLGVERDAGCWVEEAYSAA